MHTKSNTDAHVNAYTHRHTRTYRAYPSSSFYGLFSTSAGIDHCADRNTFSPSAALLQPALGTVTELCNSFCVDHCMHNCKTGDLSSHCISHHSQI